MNYTRSEIVSGLFVIAALVLFALFAFRTLPFDPLGAFAGRSVTCYTTLSDASGIAAGSPVLVAGHEVGQVTKVELVQRTTGPEASDEVPAGSTRQGARVYFRIDKPTLRLDAQTASVQLAKSGVLGRRFLSLDPGHWQGDKPPRLAARGDEPIEIPGRVTPGIQETLASMKPLAGRAKRIARKLDEQVLSKKNVEVMSAAIQDLRHASHRVRQMLRANEGALDRKALDPLHEVLTNASNSVDKLRKRLLDTTLPRAEQMMADGSALANQAKTVVDDNAPRVKKLLRQAVKSTRTAEKRLAAVADDAEALLERGDNLLAKNQPELTETVRRARRALWQAEMGLRKIRADPAVLLFGDDERLLGAEPYDASWLRESGRAEPYQQRDEND